MEVKYSSRRIVFVFSVFSHSQQNLIQVKSGFTQNLNFVEGGCSLNLLEWTQEEEEEEESTVSPEAS